MEIMTSYQLAKIRKHLLLTQGYECKACGCEVHDEYGIGRNSPTKAQLDHIVALANGGSNDNSNFQILCRKCNLRKSKMDDSYFKNLIKAELEYKKKYPERFNKLCVGCEEGVELLIGNTELCRLCYQKENRRRSYQKQKMKRELDKIQAK
ncbi:HNH endonuclease [Ureibacillus composti]